MVNKNENKNEEKKMEYTAPTHIVPVKFCNQIRVWQLACDVTDDTLLAFARFLFYIRLCQTSIRRSLAGSEVAFSANTSADRVRDAAGFGKFLMKNILKYLSNFILF